MPLTRQGIKSMTLEYADQIRDKLKSDLKKRIEDDERFSLSLRRVELRKKQTLYVYEYP